MMGQSVQVRRHGIDGRERRIRSRRDRRLDAILLTLVLREQRPLLLELVLVVVVLSLLVVSTLIGHVRG